MTIDRVGASRHRRPGRVGDPWRRHSPARGRRLTTTEAVAERLIATRAGAWSVIHLVSPLDRRLLARTGGRRSIGARYYRTGLLQTVGARSGLTRSVPLQYVVDGDRVILVASNGGSATSPAWAHNLRSEPRCVLAGPDGPRRYRAREVGGDERATAWSAATDWYRGYEAYQRRAWPRTVPVFVLEPESAGDGADRTKVAAKGGARCGS